MAQSDRLSDLKDVALHYSSLAFNVRMSALVFVGATLAAALEFFKDPEDGNIVGTTLIVVIGALSALNYRYTHSYLSACYGADRVGGLAKEARVGEAWHEFRILNERPYRRLPMRLLLAWSTYAPGLIAGAYIILQAEPINAIGWTGIVLGIITATIWAMSSILNPMNRGVVRAEHPSTQH